MNNDPNTGKFVSGNNANPNGKNGHMVGYQPFGRRVSDWLASHSIEETLEIYQDQAKFKKLSGYDGLVVTAIIDAYVGKDRGAERERVLSRIEGKPKESVDVNLSGEVGHKHGLEDSARNFIESQLNGIAARLGAASDPKPTDETGTPRPTV